MSWTCWSKRWPKRRARRTRSGGWVVGARREHAWKQNIRVCVHTRRQYPSVRYEIIILATDIVRTMQGMCICNCKSGKDRYSSFYFPNPNPQPHTRSTVYRHNNNNFNQHHTHDKELDSLFPLNSCLHSPRPFLYHVPRTSMAVTLQQARFLCRHHSIPGDVRSYLVRALRLPWRRVGRLSVNPELELTQYRVCIFCVCAGPIDREYNVAKPSRHPTTNRGEDPEKERHLVRACSVQVQWCIGYCYWFFALRMQCCVKGGVCYLEV